jgi:hypothetical protein
VGQPSAGTSLAEFMRVLNDDGNLAVGEFLPDPDFQRKSTVTAWCQDAEFVLVDARGNILHYLELFSGAK